jgi:hypothetical protein
MPVSQATSTPRSVDAAGPATGSPRTVLIISAILTGLLYGIPALAVVAWPLRLLSTLAHELGHGLVAMAVGGRFEALMIWSDGSGMATWSASVGRLGYALIAAGGLLGPACAAALCFALGRSAHRARLALIVLGSTLAVVDLLVVRSLFGVVFVAAVAVILVVVGARAQPWLAQGTLVFLAVQLALSVFARADYLFTAAAQTERGTMPSDTARIAEALILPHWVWGLVCGLTSIAVIVAALAAYIRPMGRSA